MTYPGNPTLSPEIQDRILTTFRQTLVLAERGDRQEALLGCDFILRLDPVFEPARQLQRRLQQSDGEVAVDDFQEFAEESLGSTPEAAEPAAEEEPPAEEEDFELGHLELDLDLGTTDSAEPPSPPVAASTAAERPAASLRDEMTRLFEERRFKDVGALAEREREAVRSDPELQQLAGQAAEILEAEPYLLSFLDSARQMTQQGRSEEAAALLKKARELDPKHPGVAALEREIGPPSADESRETAAPPSDQPAQEAGTVDSLSAQSLFDEEESLLGASLDSESEGRIAQLLEEGQGAFEKGEYQGAIDAWSRIFLIDIDHTEASRRIELARKLKAEVERKIEEAFHEGITHLESGAADEARAAFEQVLEIQPNHLGAREYLQRIEQGEVTAPVAAESPGAADELLEEPADLEEAVEVDSGITTTDASSLPLDVSPAARRRAVTALGPGPSSRRSLFAILGGVVLVLVLAGAWLLYSKRSQMFPNTEGAPTAQTTVEQDPIARAQGLHADGKTSMAVAQLRRLPPQHPQYAEAQGLIAQWETGTGPGAFESAGPSEEELARRSELLNEARRALDRGEGLTAVALLQDATAIAPLEGDETELDDAVAGRLDPFQAELDLFRQGDWEFALRGLWRLFLDDPDDRDLRRLIVDSYFNLGVRDLQRELPVEAAKNFAEALELAPDDGELQRLAAFAAAYQERRSDLLYRIFVKYYPIRSHGTKS